MTWSLEFKAQLRDPNPPTPVFVVSPVKLALNEGPSSTYSVASHPGLGPSDLIADGSVEILGQSVDTVQFSSRLGGFGFQLRDPINMALASWVRGMLLELRMGWPGWALDDFQTIAIGQLKAITGPGPLWSVECWDLWAALESRITWTVAQHGLFYNVMASTVVATSDYSSGGGTLTVASTSGFQRETGGKFVVRVTANDGDQFYLIATASTGTTFTINPTSGQFDTTADDADEDQVVEEVAYLSGHPRDIFRRVLASTGAGSNGSYDDYPKSWGYAIPDAYLDHQDLARFSQVIASARVWDLIAPMDMQDSAGDATGEVPSGWAWLQERFAVAGVWPVVHEGQLSLRAAQDITSQGIHTTGEVITDDDIIEVTGQQIWADSHPIEYASLVINWVGGQENRADTVATLPSVASLRRNGFDEDTTSLNFLDENGAIDVCARCLYWLTRVPERLTVMLRGLHWMRLVPGDVVDYEGTRTTSRKGARAGLAIISRQAMVTQVNPSLLSATVEVALEFLPEWAGE